jgi:SET domain-containing protein
MAKRRTHARGRARSRVAPVRKRNPWLVLRRSRIQGRGVYARKDIPKDTRLIEYTGERISSAEADRRADLEEAKARHHTFLFILNSRTCIDASKGGNVSRFINHSCDPNCVAWIEGQHIWIDALRDIREGEELSYDYEYDFLADYTVMDLEGYACHCGSPKCRGTLVDVPASKKHLIRALRRRQKAAARSRR